MRNIILAAKNNACRRTKNRLKEHGPAFHQTDRCFPTCLNGLEGILVISKDNWSGWLPVDELNITPN